MNDDVSLKKTDMLKPVDTPLIRAMIKIFERLDADIDRPLNVWLAGGIAMHIYNQLRSTGDIDAEFGSRIFIPNNLIVDVEDGNEDQAKKLYFDTNYSAMFALAHQDYQHDAIPLDLGYPDRGPKFLKVYVLCPVDLAVSKIARFSENDQKDIENLVKQRLVSSKEIEIRAMEALSHFVGNTNMLRFNIRDAVDIAKEAEKSASFRLAEPCGSSW